MSYSTEADLLKRIKKIEYDKLVAPSTGDGLTAGNIRDEAIASADSLIDSYLQNRISSLPLDEPPKAIVQCSCDIVIYNLHCRIQYQDIPEWVQTRYNYCIKYLQDIAKGLVSLSSESIADETYSEGISYETERSIFNSSTF